MLNYIAFKNYKAFQSGELEIKPLTILLGANSSGKSSLIKLIMMLTQSINYQREYKSLLKLNGDYANLGEIQNIFYQKNTSQPLTLSFKINKDSFFTQIRKFQIDRDHVIITAYLQIMNELNSTDWLANIIKPILSDLNQSFFNSNLTFISKLKLLSTTIKKIKRHYNKTTKQQSIKLSKTLQELFAIDVNSYMEANDILNVFMKEQNKTTAIIFQISFKAIKNSKTPYISTLSIKFDNKIVVKYSKEARQHSLTSEFNYFSDINKYHTIFSKKIVSNQIFTRIFTLNSTIFAGTVVDLLLTIFNSCTKQLNDDLEESKINYITPLRASPKRYYFLDEFNVNSSLNTIDGDNLTEILKENHTIKSKVNSWLQKYGLKVDVDELQNEIHSLKIGQYGLNLSVQDVGFGISQVLPIIVQGFLSQKNSLTLIEQPEIHLHPKMQAELTDLFLDIVSTKKNLLIETHSEYFLKRLRRRIAEGKISSNDVAIYYIESDGSGKGSKISKIDISRTGAFEWPRDFYADDLEDTIEFLKHQKNDDNSLENLLSTEKQTINTQSAK